MEINTTKNIYDRMVKQQFVVSLLGYFDQELLLNLLRITDKELSNQEVEGAIKRKIFHFMVECTQNLLKISHTPEFTGHKNIFLIGQQGNDYTVHLGGPLKRGNVDLLLEAISEVNDIEDTEIKQKYLDQLRSTEVLDKNSLLLSMLSISKKTKKKIEYDLIDIDDTSSFLSFKMTISN